MANEIEKRYYSIGEVAEIFDVSTSLIRFWESKFDIISPRKNKNGVRQYTQKDIHTLRSIYHLVKEKGYTLSGAQDILKNNPHFDDKIQAIDSLKKVRSFLEDLKSKI